MFERCVEVNQTPSEEVDPYVTYALIDRMRTRKGGWSRKSLAYLGVNYPPEKGWKLRIVGKHRRPLK